MRKYKSGFKNHIFLLILVLIFCLGIGYAVINRTLTITGNSEIVKNTWDVHFENVQVKDGSVDADSLPVIDTETKTSISFNVMLNLPGDFYEFMVDVVNAGSIDAMIDSITKTPELTTEQAKYLNYIIEYQNGEVIQSKQLVKSNKFVRFKVRVEYRKDLNAEDLPTIFETLNLGFIINFVQADSTGISVKDNGVYKVLPISNGSLDDIGSIVTIGTEQFYTIGIDGDNVKLLSMYNLYVGGTYIVDKDIWNAYGEEATGMQAQNMRGVVSKENLSNGTTPFSSEENKGIYYRDYKGSIVEGYVNNYKKLLNLNFGLDIVEIRLINKEEITNSETFNCDFKRECCSTAYPWIYSTSYWIDSLDPYAGSDEYEIVMRINYSNVFLPSHYYAKNHSGVRPVLVVPKNEIAVKFTIDDTTYYSVEGMTFGEWVNSQYNTFGAFIGPDGNVICLDSLCRHVIEFSSTDTVIEANGNFKSCPYSLT